MGLLIYSNHSNSPSRSFQQYLDKELTLHQEQKEKIISWTSFTGFDKDLQTEMRLFYHPWNTNHVPQIPLLTPPLGLYVIANP
jgi:hypothetical protein